jgi:N-acetylmuramoyl-L-alanine amidase
VTAGSLRIYATGEWGAAQPRGRIQLVGRPVRILIHHTAGHHPELAAIPSVESFAEACAYARSIQLSHFGRGWLDSGQNFTVFRNGLVFEGRHGSIAAIARGRMVESAHCPGENDQPGIEHEHQVGEPLTPAQAAASVALQAWICRHTGIRPSSGIHGHREYYATDCPDTIEQLLPQLRLQVAAALSSAPKKKRPAAAGGPSPLPGWWWAWTAWKLRGGAGARPRGVPDVVPSWAWQRLSSFLLHRLKVPA